MCYNFNFSEGIDFVTQDEFRKSIRKNMPTDDYGLRKLRILLSNKRVEITEVAYSGSGFFDIKQKYKNVIRFKIASKALGNIEANLLYNAKNN